jgi:taurine dioxygenase
VGPRLVEGLAPTFGARVVGLDLSSEFDGISSRSLVDALMTHRVLVFPQQCLSHADHVRLSGLFGRPDVYLLEQYAVPGFPQVVTISNIFRDGQPIGLYDGDNETEWHADLSWKEEMSSASLLYSVVAPSEGGETLFADTTAAFEELPESDRLRLLPLRAVHSMASLTTRQQQKSALKPPLTAQQATQAPDVTHPLVQTHPTTGRRSLLLGDMVIRGIVGMPESEANSLLDTLHSHATSARYVYRHRWEPGDLVIWDNRAVIHTASPCDHTRHQRLLYRTTVY